MWKNMKRNMEWLVIVALLVGAVMAVGCGENKRTYTGSGSVYAGADIYEFIGTTVTLKASVTGISDSEIAHQGWEVVNEASSEVTKMTVDKYTMTMNPVRAGLYEYRYYIDLENGERAEDTVIVRFYSVNDKTVSAGNVIMTANPTHELTGTLINIEPSQIKSWGWSIVSKPDNDPTSFYPELSSKQYATTVSPLTYGVYEYKFRVILQTGETYEDTVKMYYGSSIQAVDAGKDKVVTNASNELTGTLININTTDVKDWGWSIVSKPDNDYTGFYSGISSKPYTTTVSPITYGVYEYKFSITLLTGESYEDTVKMFFGPSAGSVYAGNDKVVTEPRNELTGILININPADVKDWGWSIISKPDNDTTPIYEAISDKPYSKMVSPLTYGVYQYKFRVTLLTGETYEDMVKITFNAPSTNTPPEANAGTPKAGIAIGNQVLLSGSGTDNDNDPLTYKWTLTKPNPSIKSDTPTLSGADTPAPYFTTAESGIYTATLIVNDGKVDSAPSTVTITVDPPVVPSNIAPVADAGPAQNATPDNPVTLDGHMSSDANGNTLAYAWTLTTKPSGSTAALTNDKTVNPTFTPDLLGDYTASLVVFDGIAYSSNTATVTITVKAPTGGGTPTYVTSLKNILGNNTFMVASNGLKEVLEFGTQGLSTGMTFTSLNQATSGSHLRRDSFWSVTDGGGYALASESAMFARYLNSAAPVDAANTLTMPGYSTYWGLTGTAAETWLKVAPVAASDFSGHTLSAYIDVYSLSYSFTADSKGTYNDGYNNVSFSWSIDARSRNAILSFADGSKHHLYLTTRGLISGSREAGIIKFDSAGTVTSGALNTWTYN